MWTLSRGGVAGAAFVVRIDTGVVDSWGGVIGRRSIRLASRQGCLVVRLVVLSLLFLPAAGQRTGGIVGNSNVWGRYVHPIASSNGMNGELRALVMWFNNPGIGSEGVAMREWGLSIRLASREDCLL